jgi:predicted hydrocarbon binding protein
MPDTKLGTRSVELLVNAGLIAWCTHCDKTIKFQAMQRNSYIVVNVYKDDKWNRVEMYHPACYLEAGLPYGEPDRTNAQKLKR